MPIKNTDNEFGKIKACHYQLLPKNKKNWIWKMVNFFIALIYEWIK